MFCIPATVVTAKRNLFAEDGIDSRNWCTITLLVFTVRYPATSSRGRPGGRRGTRSDRGKPRRGRTLVGPVVEIDGVVDALRGLADSVVGYRHERIGSVVSLVDSLQNCVDDRRGREVTVSDRRDIPRAVIR